MTHMALSSPIICQVWICSQLKNIMQCTNKCNHCKNANQQSNLKDTQGNSPPHPHHTLVKNKTSSHQIECGARMPLSRKGGAAIDAEGKPPLFPDAVNSRCVFHICLLPEKKWKSMKRVFSGDSEGKILQSWMIIELSVVILRRDIMWQSLLI